MTYWSRKSKISFGLGSSSHLSSELSESSSSMISLQRSMHSSQMYTPGPAMSFLTCFCDLPQKLHLTRSPPSLNPAMSSPAPLRHAGGDGRRRELTTGDDLVDEAVLPRFLRAHDEVAVGVLGHSVDGLAGVMGQHLVEEVA